MHKQWLMLGGLSLWELVILILWIFLPGTGWAFEDNPTFSNAATAAWIFLSAAIAHLVFLLILAGGMRLPRAQMSGHFVNGVMWVLPAIAAFWWAGDNASPPTPATQEYIQWKFILAIAGIIAITSLRSAVEKIYNAYTRADIKAMIRAKK